MGIATASRQARERRKRRDAYKEDIGSKAKAGVDLEDVQRSTSISIATGYYSA
jgi:hypothetical protein